MSHYHAVVWLDHAEAHVLHFSREDVQPSDGELLAYARKHFRAIDQMRGL